jgi:hypothetical protein
LKILIILHRDELIFYEELFGVQFGDSNDNTQANRSSDQTFTLYSQADSLEEEPQIMIDAIKIK